MTRQLTEMSRVSEWLEKCLAAKDWTIAELSRQSHVDRRSIERLRDGEVAPRIATIRALAIAMDVNPDAAGNYAVGASSYMPLPELVERDASGRITAIGLTIAPDRTPPDATALLDRAAAIIQDFISERKASGRPIENIRAELADKIEPLIEEAARLASETSKSHRSAGLPMRSAALRKQSKGTRKEGLKGE